MVLEQKIKFVFRDPAEAEKPDEVAFSSLYLIRRDAKKMLGFDPLTGERIFENRFHFSAISAIMSGIDILAKYYAGATSLRGSTTRFKQFLDEFGHKQTADLWFGLRCGLAHAYGLIDHNSHGTRLLFQLDENQPLDRNLFYFHNKVYHTNPLRLHDHFEEMVSNYYAKLQSDADRLKAFEKAFDFLGGPGIRLYSTPTIEQKND
jgi:hypothetical protein